MSAQSLKLGYNFEVLELRCDLGGDGGLNYCQSTAVSQLLSVVECRLVEACERSTFGGLGRNVNELHSFLCE